MFLPSLDRLGRKGEFKRLKPAYRHGAGTVVYFHHRQHPGGHGLFDFVHRDPKA